MKVKNKTKCTQAHEDQTQEDYCVKSYVIINSEEKYKAKESITYNPSRNEYSTWKNANISLYILKYWNVKGNIVLIS